MKSKIWLPYSLIFWMQNLNNIDKIGASDEFVKSHLGYLVSYR